MCILLALGDVPLDEIVVDARRGRFDAPEAPGNGGQGVGDEEKGVGLVLGQDVLEMEVGLRRFSRSKVWRPSSSKASTSGFL